MEKLIELVKVINRNKTKSISILGKGKTSMLDKFYHLIADGKVTTDEEAFILLYGKHGSRGAFHKSKHQLQDRLYNLAFFVDAKQAKFDSRKQAFIECQFKTCLANILNALQARENMADVCKKIMTISEKYDFTSEHLNAATKLLNYYKISGKIKEANDTIELIASLAELQRKELYASIYWAKINLQFVKDRSLKSELSVEAAGYVKLLRELPASISSQPLEYYSAVLEMSVFMMSGRYEEATAVLSPALDRVSNHKYTDSSFFYGLAINLVACYIPLKKYEAGESIVNKIYAQLQEGSFNWFKTRELHFILLLHTKRYQEALTLYQDTITHKEYEGLPEYLREIWIIYNANLRILANAGKIPLTKKQQGSAFRISHYLNSLPTFSKDKRGQNVPVLISQIILLLQQNKFNEVVDRFEAVGKYRERYAGVEKNFRGNIFLHMLLDVTKGEFVRPKIERRSAKRRALLDTVLIDITSQGYDQEILPYEDTWELLLDAL